MAYWMGTAAAQSVSTTIWHTWEITGIPQNCTLAELVLLLKWVADGGSPPTKATVFLSHDDDGIIGVVPFSTSSATQNINRRDADSLGAFMAFGLGGVWISDAGENPRVHCKFDTGTFLCTPRLYAVRTREP